MEKAERSGGERASAPDRSRTRTRRRSVAGSVSGTYRKFASVLAVCGMLSTSGCAYTYDPADYKKGGDMAKDIGRDYTLTVLLVPMVIAGILAALSK